MFDVCIIGAGVVGSAIARELSKYKVTVALVDKGEDVSQGASKANSGIVHGGYAAKHGTLKAALCAEGNRRFEEWERELHFGYRRTGSLVVGFDERDRSTIEALYENGENNGVRGLEILDAPAIRALEPNANRQITCALYCDSAGVTSPYELTIALAENAIANGVELFLNRRVTSVETGSSFAVHTELGTIQCNFVVNAAGVMSDKIAEMVGLRDFTITPRKGEYILFERGYGRLVNTVIFQTPTERGKGILVTSTYHGNLMIGPNAEDADGRDDTGTTGDHLKQIIATARKSVPSFDLSRVITNFSGIRATSSRKDFIIEESSVPRFINVAGIESPGLTSSPAIAVRVVQLLATSGLALRPKFGFHARRAPIITPKSLKSDELKRRVELASGPERIVCRCEQVSEAEILDAMGRGIPVETTDAVKRRTRAGMGQCQGQFCRPRVCALLARELGRRPEEIRIRADETATAGRPGNSFFQDLAKAERQSDQERGMSPEAVGRVGGD